MSIKPFGPNEVLQAIQIIPEEVIAAVNKLLVKRYRYASSSVYIDVDDIIETSNEIFVESGKSAPDREVYFHENYLEIEPLYESHGWKKVAYDKPAYSDSYKPRFIFTK